MQAAKPPERSPPGVYSGVTEAPASTAITVRKQWIVIGVFSALAVIVELCSIHMEPGDYVRVGELMDKGRTNEAAALLEKANAAPAACIEDELARIRRNLAKFFG